MSSLLLLDVYAPTTFDVVKQLILDDYLFRSVGFVAGGGGVGGSATDPSSKALLMCCRISTLNLSKILSWSMAMWRTNELRTSSTVASLLLLSAPHSRHLPPFSSNLELHASVIGASKCPNKWHLYWRNEPTSSPQIWQWTGPPGVGAPAVGLVPF